MVDKPRSRITVGFHRFGVVLATPFLVGAATAAIVQWWNPTGPLVMVMPAGTLAWGVGSNPDDIAKQIIVEQHGVGFNVPYGVMVVGLPIGTVHHNNATWTKVQLPDGREIGIGTTVPQKISDVARDFLLAEKKAGHPFIDLDRIIDGVPVAFLNPVDQFPPATPPWQHKEREWMWAVLGLSAGLAVYVVFRATGWVINGFLTGPRE